MFSSLVFTPFLGGISRHFILDERFLVYLVFEYFYLNFNRLEENILVEAFVFENCREVDRKYLKNGENRLL